MLDNCSSFSRQTTIVYKTENVDLNMKPVTINMILRQISELSQLVPPYNLVYDTFVIGCYPHWPYGAMNQFRLCIKGSGLH